MKMCAIIDVAREPKQGSVAFASGRNTRGGFTLVEVVISFAIVTMAFLGILRAYAYSMERAEWSAHSLAAQSLASQEAEALRAAKWEPFTQQGIDEMGVTNFTRIETLDIPEGGAPTPATNLVSVTVASVNPPLRQIRVDCLWNFPRLGVYTNTVITLRAPDQ